MVIINDGSRFWPSKLVFFPTEDELLELQARLPCTEHLEVMTTDALVNDDSNLVYKNIVITTCINLQEDLAAIYAKMDPTSCRYTIRKAEKVKDSFLIVNNTPAAYDDFLNLHNSIAHAKGFSGLSEKELIRGYAPVSDCRVIYFDGKPVCSHLMIRDFSAKRVRMKFSASARLENKEMAALSGIMNRYLHWQEIQTYKAEGFYIYDFGGIGDRPEWLTITKFKLSFGGYIEERNSYGFDGKLRKAWNQTYWRLRSIIALRSRLRSAFSRYRPEARYIHKEKASEQCPKGLV